MDVEAPSGSSEVALSVDSALQQGRHPRREIVEILQRFELSQLFWIAPRCRNPKERLSGTLLADLDAALLAELEAALLADLDAALLAELDAALLADLDAALLAELDAALRADLDAALLTALFGATLLSLQRDFDVAHEGFVFGEKLRDGGVYGHGDLLPGGWTFKE